MDLIEAEAALGQRPLQRAHRAKGLAIRGVNLRLGQRAPDGRVRIGGNLLGNVVVQPGVGQQPRLGQVRAVGGKALHEHAARAAAECLSSCGCGAGWVLPSAASRCRAICA